MCVGVVMSPSLPQPLPLVLYEDDEIHAPRAKQRASQHTGGQTNTTLQLPTIPHVDRMPTNPFAHALTHTH